MTEDILELSRITGIETNKIQNLMIKNLDTPDTFLKKQNLSAIKQVLSMIPQTTEQKQVLFTAYFSNFEDASRLICSANHVAEKFNLEPSFCLPLIASSKCIKSHSPETFVKSLNSIFKALSLSPLETQDLIKGTRQILSSDLMLMSANISLFSDTFKFKPCLTREIFLQSPKLLFTPSLAFRIDTIKTIFNLSSSEIEPFVSSHQQLLFVSPQRTQTMVDFLYKTFAFSDDELSAIFRAFPELITKKTEQITEFQKTLSTTLGLSSAETKEIVLRYPWILKTATKNIEETLTALYSSKLFAKLDLKSLIKKYPLAIETTPKDIANNILDLARVFDLKDKKQVSEFLREAPRALFSNNLKSKLVFLDKNDISLADINAYPALLSENKNTIAIKNTLLSLFGLGYLIAHASGIDYKLLISRLKFLGLSKHALSDAVMDEKSFEEKYGANTSHSLDQQIFAIEIKNILNKINGSLKKCHFAKMFNQNYLTEIKIVTNRAKQSDQVAKSEQSHKKAIQTILEMLGVESHFAKVIKKNLPNFVEPCSIVSIIELLKNAGIPREQIINAIEKRPSILALSPCTISEKLINHSQTIQKIKFDFAKYV